MTERFPSAALAGIRGVILDVGNVLIRLIPLKTIIQSRERVARTAVPLGNLDLDPLRQLRSDPVSDRLERGQATEKEFYDAVRRAFGVELEDEEIQSVYDGILGESMPGMADLIGDLQARGIRVIGLSNISPGHLKLIQSYPEVKALEDLVASCLTSYRKPEPEAYREALARIGTEAWETLFVDDQLENVEGARRAGLPAVVFRGAEALRSLMGLV